MAFLNKESIRAVVERSDTLEGRYFDLCVQLLVLVSVVTFTLETLPDLSATQQLILRYAEALLIGMFTAEYFVRLWVAKVRMNFVLSFYGVIDLVAILPFYLAAGIDLRALRAVRFLRLFRLLKLARYSQALNRLGIALRLAREELVLFLAMSLVVIYLAAVGIYYFERSAQPEAFASVPHALWWAVVTLTTVGYGDLYPITAGGKAFTFIILFVGLGLVAVPAGIVASSLAKARELTTNPDLQR